MEVKVDYSLCKECGICVSECPHHKPKAGHKHVDHSYEFCDECLHCYSVCPNHAIITDEKEDIPVRNTLSHETLISHFMYRRSYRQFISKPVPEEVLDHLLDAARYIPSGGNDHRFEITLLTSEEKRVQLLSAIYNYYQRINKLLTNPLLQQLAKRIGDPKVKATLNDPMNFKKIMNVISQLGGKIDIVFYNSPATFIFHTDRIMPTAMEDCILAAYNVSLLSETLGLGSCFVSLSQQAITNDKKCKEILSIPASHKVHAVVIAGYPQRIYKRPAIRKPKLVNIQ